MGLPWNTVLALGAAVLWGGGDFTGGMGVRRAGGSSGAALRLVLMSHLASFSVLVGLAWQEGYPRPHGAVFWWGIVGGCVGGLAIFLFYLALARGAMGAAAAVSGVLAAAIPAGVSAFMEGRPGWLHLVGFATAGAAIWLIAGTGSREGDARTTRLAVTSGVGFGVYFVCLKFAAAGGVVWAMAAARIGSLGLCSLILGVSVLMSRKPGAIHFGRVVALCALLSAVMDTSGNMLFMAATRAGRLDIASVLASLYPASTILLAAWLVKEMPSQRQGWGMALAALGIVMIAL